MAADARDLPVADVRAVLTVVGRGDLPFASLHRRPLLQHALAALEDVLPGRVSLVADPADVRRTAKAAGHRTVNVLTPTEWRQESSRWGCPVLVHDPLCPLVGGDFLHEVLSAGAGDPDVSVVAFRPVTDTVKNMPERRITGTVDRETLATVASPVLVSPGSRARAGDVDALPLGSGTALTAWVHRHGPVRMLRAPSLARRVDDLASLHLLQCLDEVRRRTRSG
jgi:hypothetical protein